MMSGSEVKWKSRRDNKQLCLILFIITAYFSYLSILMAAFLSLYVLGVIILSLYTNPVFLRTINRLCQFVLSKTFSRSTNAMYFYVFVRLSIMSHNSIINSLISLLFLKPKLSSHSSSILLSNYL